MQDGHDPDPVADPCVVHYGDSTPAMRLEIIDGPSALAYLFSVAQPPATPAWEQYYFPLQILLCRSIYFAFVRGSRAGKFKPDPTGVPVMSCLTYIEGVISPAFMYGSTFNSGAACIADGQVLKDARGILLDGWRRRLMNKGVAMMGAIQAGLPATGPVAGQDPPFSPIAPMVAKELAKQFFLRLLAVPEVQSAAGTTFKAIEAVILANWNPTPPAPMVAMPYTMAAAIATYLEPMLEDLEEVVQYRFKAESYIPDALITYFRPLLQKWLTPHMFPPTALAPPEAPPPPGSPPAPVLTPNFDPATEIPLSVVKSTFDPAQAALLATFWALTKTFMQKALDQFYNDWVYKKISSAAKSTGDVLRRIASQV